MKKRIQRTFSRLRKLNGNSLVEYCFIIAIVSIAAVVMLKGIGKATNSLLASTNNNMPK